MLRASLEVIASMVDILEKHEYYGPEWAVQARNVLQDIENWNEDEEEHLDGTI